jgi:hypothetical protein
MLTDQKIIEKYGQPGEPANLTIITLPYPNRIAWDTKTIITRTQCHKLIAGNLLSVHTQLLSHYGLTELQRLGIDLFGGCYNFRKMRGGNRWSRHSWAIAEDRDPARNGLKTKKPKAQFSKPEYKAMIDIYYANGFIGYGPEKDYDWMHWEINN